MIPAFVFHVIIVAAEGLFLFSFSERKKEPILSSAYHWATNNILKIIPKKKQDINEYILLLMRLASITI